MNEILEYYKKLMHEGGLKKFSSGDRFFIYGVPEGAHSFAAAAVRKIFPDRQCLLILERNSDAENFVKELASFIPSEEISFLPGNEGIPYELAHFPPELNGDRIRAIGKIFSGKPSVTAASAAGFLQKVPLRKHIEEKIIRIRKDDEISQTELAAKLVSSGYRREVICESPGYFSLKGGILDVFCRAEDFPYRLDFFGDTVESIKSYDPFTQKSSAEYKEILIFPSDEYAMNEEEKALYREEIEKRHEISAHLDSENPLEELASIVLSLGGILSCFKKPPVIIIPDPSGVKERLLVFEREYDTIYEKKKSVLSFLPPEKLISKGDERNILFNSSAICFRPVFKDLLSAGEMSLDISSGTQFRGKIREAREKIEEILTDEEARVLLLTSFTAQAERLTGLFKEQNPLYRNSGEEVEFIELSAESRFQIIVSDLRSGFILNEKKIYIFTEKDIFGREYKRKNKFKKTTSRAIDSFIDLREGDYIVHIQHGIGRFKRIEKVEAGGKVRDFIRLQYGDENTLFIPLDQISQIQRYAGGLEHPPLDTLGKGLWKKKLERAKKSVSRLAEELLIAYANRMKLQGYAFPPDSIWQEEFEAEFEYEETPDQISAIEAVKNDLESPRPMDRLICGDVGYGKTEVAIRAAFKVVMSGKKVLFIAPTTILALQHYNTLKNRYENYPIAVEMVSRFRTAGEIKDIISRFNENKIDILVGTHALLNSKTDMKNLGLLIIDEEQRFGVNQKESFKKYKNMVDVLTLSATPIPRTLHMSLTGIRDLSIIETPPKNRQSVETYVMDEDDEIIIHAVRRELERGGQVFYLYNRVASIETEADYLRNLVPEVSVGILHGQLTEEEVEETIMDFAARKYDVLVTTTIIESGIDMPNVNTIMVKRADMFGLSQLYQIRGRVGRAGRKAYAYLFYPKDKSLTEQAEKRLSTIHEYQELGSGFKVAMRDLEIRGAGNLLGKEQSGNIMEIGFELYVKLLNEEVSRLKNEAVHVEIRTQINLNTDFYIPEDYISDTRQKVEFYKKFEAAADLEEIDELSKEMRDRFGEFPESVKTFIMLEKIRSVSSSLGFESITEDEGNIRMKAGQHFAGDPERMIQIISDPSSKLSMIPRQPNVLRFTPSSEKTSVRLEGLLKILQKIAGKSRSKKD